MLHVVNLLNIEAFRKLGLFASSVTDFHSSKDLMADRWFICLRCNKRSSRKITLYVVWNNSILLINELEWMWKEAVLAYLKVYLGSCIGGLR
jgi:hypothetical protein